MLFHFSIVLAVICCIACIACSIQVSFVWNLYEEVETVNFGNGFRCKTSFIDEEVDSALPACIVLKNFSFLKVIVFHLIFIKSHLFYLNLK
jgi:hypothetical protein